MILSLSLDAANDLARNIAKERGAVFGWHRLTLSQLAAVVARPALATRGLVPLSRIGAEATVARLVHQKKDAGGLGRYGDVAATPGFPRALAGVISELRLARLAPDAVSDLAPDLMPVLKAYEAELKEAGLTDWPGLLALATETASAVGNNRLPPIGVPTLFLDMPIGSEAELAFARAIAAAAPEVFATVPAADQQTLRWIRERLDIQIENLTRLRLRPTRHVEFVAPIGGS